MARCYLFMLAAACATSPSGSPRADCVQTITIDAGMDGTPETQSSVVYDGEGRWISLEERGASSGLMFSRAEASRLDWGGIAELRRDDDGDGTFRTVETYTWPALVEGEDPPVVPERVDRAIGGSPYWYWIYTITEDTAEVLAFEIEQYYVGDPEEPQVTSTQELHFDADGNIVREVYDEYQRLDRSWVGGLERLAQGFRFAYDSEAGEEVWQPSGYEFLRYDEVGRIVEVEAWWSPAGSLSASTWDCPEES